jgi:hypothetical protein
MLACGWRQVLDLALAMQACVRSVGGTRGVQLRVGVAMGAVVAGVMGAQQQRYHFFGEALDAAERLQQQCRPGEILVHPRVAATAAATADANAAAAAPRADADCFRFVQAPPAGGGARSGVDALLLVGAFETEPGLGQHSPDSCRGGGRSCCEGRGGAGEGGGRCAVGCRVTAAMAAGEIGLW